MNLELHLNMKQYTYDEARKNPGIYKTIFPGETGENPEDLGLFDFHSDGENLIPFYGGVREAEDRYIWDREIFKKIS